MQASTRASRQGGRQAYRRQTGAAQRCGRGKARHARSAARHDKPGVLALVWPTPPSQRQTTSVAACRATQGLAADGRALVMAEEPGLDGVDGAPGVAPAARLILQRHDLEGRLLAPELRPTAGEGDVALAVVAVLAGACGVALRAVVAPAAGLAGVCAGRRAPLVASVLHMLRRAEEPCAGELRRQEGQQKDRRTGRHGCEDGEAACGKARPHKA
mmetsp:Transcript_82407/g.255952  ORF Transcript_82407/g.255952 Transcript_82407/m.255952 type:complete len:215 (+) Transcript_82407:396-1040(+)